MTAIAITRRDLTASELRAEAGRTKDARAARRMLALALALEGGGIGPARPGPARRTVRRCGTGAPLQR